jgi:hypothetical protein
MQKSCAIPIRCEHPELERIEQNNPCTIAALPRTYLGLSISQMLAFLSTTTKNRITPTNTNFARNDMVIINFSLLQ